MSLSVAQHCEDTRLFVAGFYFSQHKLVGILEAETLMSGMQAGETCSSRGEAEAARLQKECAEKAILVDGLQQQVLHFSSCQLLRCRNLWKMLVSHCSSTLQLQALEQQRAMHHIQIDCLQEERNYLRNELADVRATPSTDRETDHPNETTVSNGLGSLSSDVIRKGHKMTHR